MADYFEEMGWQPLSELQTPDEYLHLARLHLARLLQDLGMWEELEINQKLPPPTSKKFLEELENCTIEKPGEKCPICLKEYAAGQVVKKLPCHHKFHSDCILPWLQKTNSCPLCRHEMPTDDPRYEEYRREKIRAKQRKEDLDTLHNSMFS